MNRIIWKTKAIKQVLKLPRQTAQVIRDTVEEKLSVFPDCNSIKKLTNHRYPYRLRAGDYRVFFDFDGEIHIINIQEVKKRDETTY
ncbi:MULTISPECIES: type II toxin-antitoxin system RelE family toxin [Nitrosomonas]|uniref:type II toxin-antitoxin system RelE family toxin n=1 Tax=Nitrosomonas TaxID=914 RepID=UPI0002EF3CD8|nr:MULTISPECIES: type II toxin-antitoxin system RelE/ParE family toxin [Nitrosomonas]KXK34972.1 MAG: plasmid stabilization system [Nitrosomonas europaea]MEB2332371.1 type II toxin-antitoxin system RelE/ParE family toxin [Nitrosomonas sp.]SDW54981.1 mRNA-degrading endonuclease RelE, toxin component of the RelBE toxin-antitoxin system [Nitrosomonas europaea]SET16144.1 mRNA-degrading endonuclease RelE, toxin component of the RelBE toxin-antitoxin system [Nitrosomonas europaea]SJZ65134.1 mRNA-degr